MLYGKTGPLCSSLLNVTGQLACFCMAKTYTLDIKNGGEMVCPLNRIARLLAEY